MTWRFRPTFVFAKMAPKIIALALSLTLALAPTLAAAQTAVIATPLPNAKQTFVDSNGKPYSGGKVYSYVPNTTTAKTTWSDTSETTPNSNPVTLDSAGRATIFGQGNYRQVLKDSAGNTIWDSFTTAVGSSRPSGSNGTDTAPVGTVMPFAGLSVPTNWALAYGQTLSRALYPDLLTALTITNAGTSCTSSSTTLSGLADTSQVRIGAPIEASCLPTGTTVATIVSSTSITVNNAATSTGTVTSTIFPWGNGDGSLTFNVPDLRGRIVAGPDSQGGTAASRLTSTYFGASAAAPGVGRGSQSQTLLTANLPAYTPAGTVATTSPSMRGAADGNPLGTSVGSPYAIGWLSATGSPAPTFSSTFTGTPQGGTSTAFATIQPTLTMSYIIKIVPNTSGAGGVVSLGGMFGDLLCGSGISCAAQTVSNSGVLSLGGLTGAISCTGGITCSAGSISITGFPTGVISFNGRTGAVVPAASDYAFSQLSGTASAAQLAAGAAATNVGSLGGDASGTLPNPTVVGLRGVGLSSTAATNGQSYIYDSTSARWNPTSTTIYLSQYVPTPSSNDTTAVQAAFNACNTAGGCVVVCPTGATYTVDTITVYSNTQVKGSCYFQQRTASNAVFTSTSTSNISFDGIHVYSVTGGLIQSQSLFTFTSVNKAAWINGDYRGSSTVDTGYPNAPSGGNAIECITCTNVTVSGNYFYRFTLIAVRIRGSSDVVVNANRFQSTYSAVYFTGNTNFAITNNVIDTTDTYSATPTAQQFSVAISLESTSGHAYGYNQRGTISNNVIHNYGWSQAVLVHAGYDLTIANNVCDNLTVCVSLNPASAAGASDVLGRITVSGNTCNGTSVSPPTAGEETCFVIQSGVAPSPLITDITFVGNSAAASNRVNPDANAGCLAIGWVLRLVVSGNTFEGCGASAIVVNSNITASIISNNQISDVVAVTGNQFGIYFRTAASGAQANLVGNMFTGMLYGVNYATGITVTNIQLASGLCISTTLCTHGP